MKIKDEQYFNGTFIDYNENIRNYTMAAITFKQVAINSEGESIPYIAVTFGVSACLPQDKADTEIGKTIAKGKAIKHMDHCVFANNLGIITPTITQKLLEQEAHFFELHPESYIAGYSLRAKKVTKK